MQYKTHRSGLDPDPIRRSRRPKALLLGLVVSIALAVASCASGPVVTPAAPGDPKPSASGSPAAGGRPPVPPVKPKGNIKQKATSHKVHREPKVPLTRTGEFENNVKVAVTKVRAVKAEAIGPGEVGGPAVAVTVRINNGSTDPIDLATTSVTLLGSDGSPGIMTTGGDSSPLSGVLQPGDKASGAYVFTIAKKLRKPITVQVQYGSGRTVLQFSGDAE
jgi:hypothetical protein